MTRPARRRAVRPRDAFEAGTLHRPRVPPPLLRTPHLVNRIRRKPFNVKPVEHHPRVRNPRPQRLLPARRQVRRHQLDPRTATRSQLLEEGPQRLRAAPPPRPHHPTLVMVNHDRQVAVTLPVAELIDADSSQLGEPSPVQPPRHNPFHDAAHGHPRYPQQAAHRRPVRHLRQIRRQFLEPRREHAAAARPRHLLHLHPAATPARHPPRRIPQPRRHPAPGQMPPLAHRLPVIPRRPLPARPAPGTPPRRLHRHRQRTVGGHFHLLDVHLRDTQQPP